MTRSSHKVRKLDELDKTKKDMCWRLTFSSHLFNWVPFTFRFPLFMEKWSKAGKTLKQHSVCSLQIRTEELHLCPTVMCFLFLCSCGWGGNKKKKHGKDRGTIDRGRMKRWNTEHLLKIWKCPFVQFQACVDFCDLHMCRLIYTTLCVCLCLAHGVRGENHQTPYVHINLRVRHGAVVVCQCWWSLHSVNKYTHEYTLCF